MTENNTGKRARRIGGDSTLSPIIMHPRLITKRSTAEVLRVGKIRIRILEDGRLTNGRIGSVEATVPARMRQTPPHLHRLHEETYFIVSGTLQFTIASGIYNASPGDFIVVPIGQPHTFANPFDAPSVFIGTFTPASFIGYFREFAVLSKTKMLNDDDIYQVMARYGTEPA